ncbi:energy transducer TonB [uncultured Litoreibacter sp.]|uniref:energy transducer TonB n=1 Tax=uncultured Litoreibacter sp. TaxID=1392394 RepID=UPI0026391D3A|nr:energy transducer TonB [uncultured Litoreibacter sp.]
MRMSPNTGTYVSGMGHAAFILYLIVGGFFVSRETDLDVEVSNVSIISGEDFEAMQAQSPGEPDLPPAPVTPVDVDQPAPAVEPDTPSDPPPPTPDPIEPEVVEPDPLPPEPVDPVETPPTPEQPEAPEVDGDPGATLIVPNVRPVPRPAERIADEVVEQPDPEVEIGETDQDATAPAADPTPVEEAQEETAREESTTQIVTEADEPSTSAPTKSARPGRKPKAPAPQVAETTAPSLADSINSAVAEANTETAVSDNENPGGGTSSPITRQEEGAFILGIQKCWNVGALGTDALAVSVVVGFKLDQAAKPDVGSIKLISSKGGSGAAVDKAYQAARRAIIICGSDGYNLPLDKYDQWREVQVSFNATSKEIR